MRVKTSAFLDLARRAKAERDAREAAILDRVAGQLNEQSDVLEFQWLPE